MKKETEADLIRKEIVKWIKENKEEFETLKDFGIGKLKDVDTIDIDFSPYEKLAYLLGQLDEAIEIYGG